MTTYEWIITLPERLHDYGRIVTHERVDRPDGGKDYWYSIDGNYGLNKLPKDELPLWNWEHLPDAKEPVVITEGEKAASALLDRGVVAVGTATGANGTPCDESLKTVLGRRVYLWADHDDVGDKHMNRIAARLFKLGVEDIRFVKPTYELNKGDDAADFTGDDGELQKLLQAAKPVDNPYVINLRELLDDVVGMITNYVILTPHEADAIALWVLHTYVFEAAETTPYLAISSPEKRSGKTRLLETLELLVHNAWNTGAVSAAALFRKVHSNQPTLLFDEADATFKGDKDLQETLRGILNSGHRQGGSVSRVVATGSFEVEDFSTFCPKAIAGIGKLPDTVTDRSIPIELRRRANHEPVSRFYIREAKEQAEPIVNRLEVWADYNVTQLADARPDLSFIVSDRSADGWEPLLAIAELAGDEWISRARRSAMATNNEDDDQSIVITLLSDIWAIYKARNDQLNISTADLIRELIDLDESPWGDWYGKEISPRNLAKWLKPHGIKSQSVRIGDHTPKGYRWKDFSDAWSRYISSFNATPQHSDSELESSGNGLLGNVNVADIKSPEMSQYKLDVAEVADRGVV